MSNPKPFPYTPKPLTILILIMVVVLSACTFLPTTPAPANTLIPTERTTEMPAQPDSLHAGLRSSSYGPQAPFPDSTYWTETSQAMAALFPASQPALVWIVGEINSDGSTGMAMLSFPAPAGQESAYTNILFSGVDRNEAYLSAFDRNGIKVWLQVEPGDADLPTLIDLVLQHYGSHPCVIGFGVDVEWYKWNHDSSPEGTAVTDAEARIWSERVRSHNPNYQLFLKHWLTEKMPPTYRSGIMFLDDSQQFADLAGMVDEFKRWGSTFAPAPVGFQYGYEADQTWWGRLANPPRAIGQELIRDIPNVTDLFWVDFTMEQIWPRR
jgi:hypothetical protein